jgi:hypothetical protein
LPCHQFCSISIQFPGLNGLPAIVPRFVGLDGLVRAITSLIDFFPWS